MLRRAYEARRSRTRCAFRTLAHAERAGLELALRGDLDAARGRKRAERARIAGGERYGGEEDCGDPSACGSHFDSSPFRAMRDAVPAYKPRYTRAR